MKLVLSTITCVLMVFLITNAAFAVVAIEKNPTVEVLDEKISKPQVLSAKKQKRLKKQLNKFKKRLKKKAVKGKKSSAIDSSILDNPRFRLGAMVFLAGIALLLLGLLLFGFVGLILWVGRVATLVGLGLMIWALIEH